MTKEFQPTYLCIKTHTITGLKYFCKTTKQNYHGYAGSGKYWTSHLKIHGRKYTTEVLGYFTNREECQRVATAFSIENNIVGAVDANNKKIWANQITENGLDGGATGRKNYKPHSEESKRKMSESHMGNIPWNVGKLGSTPGNKSPRSEETKQMIRESLRGKKQSQATKDKRSATLKGHRVTEETRTKISARQKGKKLSAGHIQKLKNRVQSEITKQKIKEKRQFQVFTEETKKKLSGKVVVVGKHGNMGKIPKEQYVNQVGPKTDWEWVAHRSNEAKQRISLRPII